MFSRSAVSRATCVRDVWNNCRIPSRTSPFKFSHPLFVATATRAPKSLPQSLGPFPRTVSTIAQDIPLSSTNLKAEHVKAKAGETTSMPSLPQTSFDERRVAVGWDVGTWSRFHNIWLRDHCRCEQCFHPITRQRLVDTFEISPDLQPLQVIATQAALEVVWHDPTQHKSAYPWTWLRRHSYDPPLRLNSTSHVSPSFSKREKVLWGSRIQRDPPTVQYQEVMGDEYAVWRWLEKIERFGFCFVTGVPPNPEDTEQLSRRIGRIRETQYGGFWDFTADLKHGDTAYTDIALKAHTDTTYFTDPCGLQLFHLLSHENGTGGSTLLVDGFYVASLLQTLHPEVYELLSKVPVPAHSAGVSSESPSFLSYLYHPKPDAGYPILRQDETTGELMQVRYNNDDRSVMCHLEPAMVEPWYHALRTWNNALTSADSEYWLQLSPGTVVAIDNQRVLHGRSAFTGERRMCGAYIGMDDYRSRFNVLEARFAESSPENQGAGRGSIWDPAF